MKTTTLTRYGVLAGTAVAACVMATVQTDAAPGHGGRDATREVTVIIENLASEGGTFLTPMWVGFHDGSFDLYDGGAPISAELERLAEDGNTAPISGLFDAEGAGEVQATIVADQGIPPIAPGETATMTFTLDGRDDANRYFSYASMVIPSNDAFVANGNPTAHRIFRHNGRFLGDEFIIYGGAVNDGGSELNDEDPMNTAFFGQMTPDTGQDETTVVHDHVGYKRPGGGGILDDAQFAAADFATPGYAIARITIIAEPYGGGGDDDDDDDDGDDDDDDGDGHGDDD